MSHNNSINSRNGWDLLEGHVQGLLRKALSGGFFEFSVTVGKEQDNRRNVTVSAGETKRFVVRSEEIPSD